MRSEIVLRADLGTCAHVTSLRPNGVTGEYPRCGAPSVAVHVGTGRALCERHAKLLRFCEQEGERARAERRPGGWGIDYSSRGPVVIRPSYPPLRVDWADISLD